MKRINATKMKGKKKNVAAVVPCFALLSIVIIFFFSVLSFFFNYNSFRFVEISALFTGNKLLKSILCRAKIKLHFFQFFVK